MKCSKMLSPRSLKSLKLRHASLRGSLFSLELLNPFLKGYISLGKEVSHRLVRDVLNLLKDEEDSVGAGSNTRGQVSESGSPVSLE